MMATRGTSHIGDRGKTRNLAPRDREASENFSAPDVAENRAAAREKERPSTDPGPLRRNLRSSGIADGSSVNTNGNADRPREKGRTNRARKDPSAQGRSSERHNGSEAQATEAESLRRDFTDEELADSDRNFGLEEFFASRGGRRTTRVDDDRMDGNDGPHRDSRGHRVAEGNQGDVTAQDHWRSESPRGTRPAAAEPHLPDPRRYDQDIRPISSERLSQKSHVTSYRHGESPQDGAADGRSRVVVQRPSAVINVDQVGTLFPVGASLKARSLAMLRERCSMSYRNCDMLKQVQFERPFDGSNRENMDDFLIRFEHRALMACWSEADQIVQLVTCLAGPALYQYNQLLENGQICDMTFDEIIAQLRRSFPATCFDASKALTAFTELEQDFEESVQAFAVRFDRAAKRAKVTDQDVLSQKWSTSIREELRHPLMMTSHMQVGSKAMFHELVAKTIELDAIMPRKEVTKKRLSDVDTESRSRKRDREAVMDILDEYEERVTRPAVARAAAQLPPAKIRNVTETEEGWDEWDDAIIAKVQRIVDSRFARQTPAEVMAGMPPSQVAMQGYKPQPAYGRGRGGYDRSRGEGRGRYQAHPQHDSLPREEACKTCGRDNHTTRECWQRLVCFRCGKPGHKAFRCREYEGQGPRGPEGPNATDESARPKYDYGGEQSQRQDNGGKPPASGANTVPVKVNGDLGQRLMQLLKAVENQTGLTQGE